MLRRQWRHKRNAAANLSGLNFCGNCENIIKAETSLKGRRCSADQNLLKRSDVADPVRRLASVRFSAHLILWLSSSRLRLTRQRHYGFFRFLHGRLRCVDEPFAGGGTGGFHQRCSESLPSSSRRLRRRRKYLQVLSDGHQLACKLMELKAVSR